MTRRGSIEAGNITAVFRTLFPHITMNTAATGPGTFEVNLPSTTAGHLAADTRPEWIAGYLTRHLDAPVRVTGVRYTRKTVLGQRARITLDTSPAPRA
jgi:hypothetical protein